MHSPPPSPEQTDPVARVERRGNMSPLALQKGLSDARRKATSPRGRQPPPTPPARNSTAAVSLEEAVGAGPNPVAAVLSPVLFRDALISRELAPVLARDKLEILAPSSGPGSAILSAWGQAAPPVLASDFGRAPAEIPGTDAGPGRRGERAQPQAPPRREHAGRRAPDLASDGRVPPVRVTMASFVQPYSLHAAY